MKPDSLRKLVGKDVWQQYSQRPGDPAVIDILRMLFESTIELLAERIDDIRDVDGKAISFFSKGREILTINITRKNLRVYVHPPSLAYFDPGLEYGVEKLSFWESSYHKKTGSYRGLSVWISDKKYLQNIEKIIRNIPQNTEV
jgi:hypothetical protein